MWNWGFIAVVSATLKVQMLQHFSKIINIAHILTKKILPNMSCSLCEELWKSGLVSLAFGLMSVVWVQGRVRSDERELLSSGQPRALSQHMNPTKISGTWQRVGLMEWIRIMGEFKRELLSSGQPSYTQLMNPTKITGISMLREDWINGIQWRDQNYGPVQERVTFFWPAPSQPMNPTKISRIQRWIHETNGTH